MTFPVVMVLGLGVALAAAGLLLVPWGHRRVVVRAGIVRRVTESGIAWHVPLAEQAVQMVSGPHALPVRVRATTVDGVPVLMWAEVEVRLLPPEIGRPWADPWQQAEAYAEHTLADLVATMPVAQLRYALRAAEPELRERLAEPVRRLGVEVLAVEVLEVDLPLASDRGPG